METINQKMTALVEALKSLHKSVELFYKYGHRFTHEPIEENRELLMSMRDSMIQRFEYSTDLFWKVIKICLEEQGIITPIVSPRGILREAIRARLLSESEGEMCMEMVESRNKTSHMYHELTAEEIAYQIPGYYELIKDITDRLEK
jgi:nucleotidyltransferase substrate binding protein (TIGR01987 family)